MTDVQIALGFIKVEAMPEMMSKEKMILVTFHF